MSADALERVITQIGVGVAVGFFVGCLVVGFLMLLGVS